MKIIAYYRVSTTRQGQSSLGLEGQQDAVEQYAASQRLLVLATYTEVETGKKADRPELGKAIAHAKRTGATLVVAKLDRRLPQYERRTYPPGEAMERRGCNESMPALAIG